MEYIRLESLNKIIGEGENAAHILKDVHFSIQKGEFVAIIGQSGSGKSTLMNILGCLDSFTSGTYTLMGQNVQTLAPDALADLRNQTFGFIFQRYNLLGVLDAQENVALPAIYNGAPKKERLARSAQLLQKLGLGEKIRHTPSKLSGGQQQRVSIARALMNGGEILLADEPTGALDSASGLNVMGILQDLHKQGHTIILVTHDPKIAAYAERIIEIQDGRIISDKENTLEAANTVQEDVADSKTGEKAEKQNSRATIPFYEICHMAVQAITSHKMRSALTMLGIIIGIAAVVSVTALGQGSQEKILENISSMGTNTITVFPGKSFGDSRSGQIKTLTVNDASALAGQSYVTGATPSTSTSGTITWLNKTKTSRLEGVGQDFASVKGLTLAQGRFFTEEEVQNQSSVVVIDDNVRKEFFADGENPLGQILLFNRQPLEIIGVTKKTESGFGPSDSLNLWIPYTTAMYKIAGNRDISSIIVQIADNTGTQAAEQNIINLLISRHNGQKDFFTQNSDTIKQTIESTTSTMTLLISCIAFISLAVGGIGVMNIMLVSVTERTREIGLRMAIGAKQKNILQQFLLEAVLLCLVGGTTGILLALLICFGFNTLSSAFSMSLSLNSILVALISATAIGLFFGFVPARNAARLNPIEALSRD